MDVYVAWEGEECYVGPLESLLHDSQYQIKARYLLQDLLAQLLDDYSSDSNDVASINVTVHLTESGPPSLVT